MQNPNNIISLIEQEIARLQSALAILRGGEVDHTVIKHKIAVHYSDEAVAPPAYITPDADGISNWTMEFYRDKFLLFMRENKRFAHLREVADWLVKSEGLDASFEQEVTTKIGVSIGTLKKSGEIVKYQINGKNQYTYWGSKNWIENGKIKPENVYNSDYPKIAASTPIVLNL